MTQPPLRFRYRNHRGTIADRAVVNAKIVYHPFGTEHHPHPGYYLEADDMDKQDKRTFRVADILEFLP